MGFEELAEHDGRVELQVWSVQPNARHRPAPTKAAGRHAPASPGARLDMLAGDAQGQFIELRYRLGVETRVALRR